MGDMGNVVSAKGVAEYKAVDELRLLQLSGETSIIGRAVVVHADPDDLGKGGFDDSKTVGHAGARLSASHNTHSTHLPSAFTAFPSHPSLTYHRCAHCLCCPAVPAE